MQKKLTERGLRYLEEGQYGKAAEVLALLIKSYPQNAEAHHMLAIIELEKGNNEIALQLAKQAIGLNSTNAVFYTTLANIEMQRRQISEAEQALLNAVKYDDHKLEYKYNLAHFYLSQSKYDLAIDYYYQILRDNPTHFLGMRGITVCYLFANEPAIALEHAQEWVASFNTYYEPHYYQGLCHFALNNIAAALAAYDKALNLAPTNHEIITAIGACYRALGNTAIAETYLHKSLALESKNPHALYNLGCINMDKKDFATARGVLLNAIHLDANYAEPICALGYIELVKGDIDVALDYFAQAQAADPNNPKPKLLMATAMLHKDELAKSWPAISSTANISSLLKNIQTWDDENFRIQNLIG